ncbi:MAG: hypothetical protein K8R21_03390, partial [Leptospira sp.]|nr:hypothetical protein [Leptospira sp.]
HKMSYIIDVYYKKTKPLGKFTDYMLYILLFPKLISGPTILFNQISDQIMDRQNSETWENRLSGFNRFCIGLARKVLIANVLGKEADRIFALGETELTFPLAWTGVLAYTFQIYFDFAGYSDMAIGLGGMMGFRFPAIQDNRYILYSHERMGSLSRRYGWCCLENLEQNVQPFWYWFNFP